MTTESKPRLFKVGFGLDEHAEITVAEGTAESAKEKAVAEYKKKVIEKVGEDPTQFWADGSVEEGFWAEEILIPAPYFLGS